MLTGCSKFPNVLSNFSIRPFTNSSHSFKIFSSLPPIIVYDPVRKNKIVGYSRAGQKNKSFKIYIFEGWMSLAYMSIAFT